MALDLSVLFRTYAGRIRKEMLQLIKSRKGIDGQPFSPLKDPPKGRSKNSRLNRTFKFRENAFVARSDSMSLTIEANPEGYDDKVTYADIVKYNTQGSSDVNPKIDQPPLIFPVSEEDIMRLESVKTFEEDLVRAVGAQLDLDLGENRVFTTRIGA